MSRVCGPIPAMLLQISACLLPLPASSSLSAWPDPPRSLLFCQCCPVPCCLPLGLSLPLLFCYPTCWDFILPSWLLTNAFLPLCLCSKLSLSAVCPSALPPRALPRSFALWLSAGFPL